MNCKPLVLIILALCSILSIQQSIFPKIETNNQYQRLYRELVKADNSIKIAKFNRDQSNGFLLKPNNFIYLTNDQFHSMYTMNVKIGDPVVQVSPFSSQSSSSQPSPKGESLEVDQQYDQQSCESINVDLSIYATPVKQQGRCQCCYAHSTLATIESMLHQENENETAFDLSEQHITECTIDWAPEGYQYVNNLGCDGGWGWKVLLYIKYYGVSLETNYPYTLGTHPTPKKCDQEAIKGERFSIAGYEKYYNKVDPQSQCHILNQKLMQGKTIAVSIWVPSGIQFQFYGSETQGIDIWNLCGDYEDVNHEVQLVGSTDKYWKLKNSFGVNWGEKGYLYLDKSKGLNCLNVCMDFAFPTGLSSLEQQQNQS